MAKVLSTLLYCIVWVISLLPMPLLYLFSDIVWAIMIICPPGGKYVENHQSDPDPQAAQREDHGAL